MTPHSSPNSSSLSSARSPAFVRPLPPLPTCFANRRDAGQHLAHALALLAWTSEAAPPLVLALPRGGVPVAFEVARSLRAPLDILLVRKIGAPGYPELALGAVVEALAGAPTNTALCQPDAHTVINDGALSRRARDSGAFDAERGRQLNEIARRGQRYRAGMPAPVMNGRTVIVVDDGVATGATMRAALEAVRMAGACRLVAGSPVGSPAGVASLADAADAVVCLRVPPGFGAVGAFYLDFAQTTDDEVCGLLREASRGWPV